MSVTYHTGSPLKFLGGGLLTCTVFDSVLDVSCSDATRHQDCKHRNNDRFLHDWWSSKIGGIRYPLGIMPTIFNPPYMMTKTAIMIPILRKFSGVIIGVLKFGGDYNDLNV